MIRRPPRSTLSSSSAASDVYKRQISNTVELVQEKAEGTIGCQFWRVRSITDTPGEFWELKELEFYSSVDATGEKIEGKAMSSTFKGDVNDATHKADKAVDGDLATYWSTSDKYKFEWIGVKFDEPQDIRSIKMQVTEAKNAPSMVIVEKSFDGEWWSRSTELADMKSWGESLQTYPLVAMDNVPKSIFSFRSQQNPRFCVGVRPTPHPTDEKADPYPLAEDAKLEVQVCDDNTNTQYWQLDALPRSMLKNAGDQSFVAHVDGSTAAGTGLSVKQCREGCAEGFEDDLWQFGAGAKGGLAFNKNQPHLVLSPKGGVLEAGTEIILEVCGAEGETAESPSCADKTGSQWELNPMFILEAGKQLIACAPYSHDNVAPTPADNREKAQEVCAKDNECVAYNWADANAEGDFTDKVFACTAMHEVHSGVQGWELGVRAGRLEPFTEEETEERTWTMYADM
eukprot:TRINITY_DN33_c0_g1_i1.p1 TRINITY_DN33_c0_g1~~TRINITY_DN33_c0_g1_i1.p1  ORF type:complete len:456 (+),score=129.77 TRINITY_DN33_c0_g1_i1:60-1427(+)